MMAVVRAARGEGPHVLRLPCREPRHSIDYRSVWLPGHGVLTFTGAQAPCVRLLWEAWENKTPEVSVATVLAAAGGEARRLKDVFRLRVSGRLVTHTALGLLIVD